MKRVDLEVRVSIKQMLKSPDRETFIMGWMMFVNEYQDEIIHRVRLRKYNQLTQPWQAIDFLTKSIAQSKRWKK